MSCAEPIYGTMCLYNKEKREKLSEDFHFRFLPSEFQDVRDFIVVWIMILGSSRDLDESVDYMGQTARGLIWFLTNVLLKLLYVSHENWSMQESGGGQKNVVFSLESGSPVICLLIQLEKHVTEEGGVTPSVYTRKEPVSVWIPLTSSNYLHIPNSSCVSGLFTIICYW